MANNEYYELTKAEREELAEMIAAGHVNPRHPRTKMDDFDITLSTGSRVLGSYMWESDWNEYVELVVLKGQNNE